VQGAGLAVPVLALWFVVSNTAGVAYSVVLHGMFGQTIGKRLFGIRVYDVSGSKLSMRQAAMRDCFPIATTALTMVIAFPVVARGRNPFDAAHLSRPGASLWLWISVAWLVLELISMLTNPYRRALHDFIAHSVVIRVPRAKRRSGRGRIRARSA
jgi:uncharacterized RDD family membrane protein YckC